jgi:glutamate-1-semialdehyde 2,1-aminomutase
VTSIAPIGPRTAGEGSANKSAAFMARARALFPGGVSSPVRSFAAVGGTPRVIDRAQGARLWDVDGNELIDYVGSWGPLILGHAHPAVVAAIKRAAQRGTSYGLPSRHEIELAEAIVEAMPSLERLRFVSSGTEAAMSSLRVARAATRRDRILKMAGGYHGHADALLVAAGSGATGLPASAGVTATVARDTTVIPYDDLSAAEGALRGGDVAALIVEPVAANVGVVEPRPGYLAGLRTITKRHGTILIFDEVITGFRVERGGAQARYGVRPDLTVLGKIIGGGLPVGAYGGHADLMALVSPEGPVYQAGTLSGNPLAMAAGAATLAELTPSVYSRLEALGAHLETGLRTVAGEAAVAVRIHRVASLLTVFFDDDPGGVRFARFFHAMLSAGFHLPPSPQEAWFVSSAHTMDDIERTVDAARSAFRSAREDS